MCVRVSVHELPGHTQAVSPDLLQEELPSGFEMCIHWRGKGKAVHKGQEHLRKTNSGKLKLLPRLLSFLPVLLVVSCSGKDPADSRPHRAAAGSMEDSAGGSRALSPPVSSKYSEKKSIAEIVPVEKLLDEPVTVRYRTAGKPRWMIESPDEVREIRPYSRGGFLLLADDEIYYITRQGEIKWNRVTGRGYRLLDNSENELVWLDSMKTLTSVGWRGSLGWEKHLEGEVFPAPGGGALVIDAAVAKLTGPDGKQLWRFSSGDYHSLDRPVFAGRMLAVEGRRGRVKAVIFLNPDGKMMSMVPVKPEERLIGFSDVSGALVSSGIGIRLLRPDGRTVFSGKITGVRAVKRKQGDFLVLSGPQDTGAPQLTWISGDGRIMWSSRLPEKDDPVYASIEGWPSGAVWVYACTGPARTCHGPDNAATTYNVLYYSNNKSDPERISGLNRSFFSCSAYMGGIITAASGEGAETFVSFFDTEGGRSWTMGFEGVLAAGPVLDEQGRFVLVSIRNRDGKHHVIAVTSRAPALQEAANPGNDPDQDRDQQPGEARPISKIRPVDAGGEIPDKKARDKDHDAKEPQQPDEPGA